jgi:hypothetical protein
MYLSTALFTGAILAYYITAVVSSTGGLLFARFNGSTAV